MHAASINFRDLMIINGAFGSRIKPGLVPLSDGAGEVVDIGPGVSRTRVGDRVALTFHPYRAEMIDPARAAGEGRGLDVPGVLAEYLLVSEHDVVRLPSHLSFEEGATLPCAAVTAWCALCLHAPLLPGEVVLVQGTGGVSIFALQLAQLFGARVLATSSSNSKLARLHSLGADAVIDYRKDAEWQELVRELAGGAGVDRVVEVGGANTLAKSIEATRHGGRISVVGMLTGMPSIGTGFFSRRLHIDTIHVGLRADFERLNRAIEHHRVVPLIDRVFEFADAADAVRHLASRQHMGKVVIRIA
jgi:NADPH:quinone reductase-like Zn-dependent oxidoreductase